MPRPADGWQWWEAAVEVENPVHGYRWLLVGDDGRHWLNQPGCRTSRRATRRLPARRARPAARVGRVERDVPGVPRPVRAVGGGRPERTPRLGDPGRVERPGRRRATGPPRCSSTAETSTACASTSTTSVARRRPALPDAGLPGAVEPPLRRVDRSTTSTRCSAATRRWSRLVEAAHARGIRVIGDLTSEPLGRRARVVPGGAGRPRGRARAPSTSAATTASRVRVVARRAEPAEVRLERPSCAAASSRAPTRSWPASSSRRSTSTAGASTSRT